jgi:hypothetical protein
MKYAVASTAGGSRSAVTSSSSGSRTRATSEPGSQAALIERGRKDAVRERAKLGGRALGVLERLVDELGRRPPGVAERLLGQLERRGAAGRRRASRARDGCGCRRRW